MNDTISSLIQVIESNPPADSILISDFNLPDIQWDTLSSTSSKSCHCAFCDFIFNNSLTQLIDQLTHIQGNTLDLVLSNSNDGMGVGSGTLVDCIRLVPLRSLLDYVM